MKTIITKYLPPTNTRGARIKAQTSDETCPISVTISYDYELNHFERHASAVVALCNKLEWHSVEFQAGGMPNGYVFVILQKCPGIRKRADLDQLKINCGKVVE